MRIAVLEVRPYNSTVLGHRANPHHDARRWGDGWINLGINDRRSRVDGKPRHGSRRKPYGMRPYGSGILYGLSCGEYLHAPVLGKGADGMFYRVRCRFQPGMKYRGRVVYSTSVRKLNGKWHWILKLE